MAVPSKEGRLVFEQFWRPLDVSSWVGRGGSWGHGDKRGYNRGEYQKKNRSPFIQARQFRREGDSTSRFHGGVGGEGGTRVRGTHIAFTCVHGNEGSQ